MGLIMTTKTTNRESLSFDVTPTDHVPHFQLIIREANTTIVTDKTMVSMLQKDTSLQVAIDPDIAKTLMEIRISSQTRTRLIPQLSSAGTVNLNLLKMFLGRLHGPRKLTKHQMVRS